MMNLNVKTMLIGWSLYADGTGWTSEEHWVDDVKNDMQGIGCREDANPGLPGKTLLKRFLHL